MPGARRRSRPTSSGAWPRPARRWCSSSTPRPRPASSVDLEPLVAACRAAGALCVVDAISSLGAVPLETDAWGVDVVVTGSQKALMTPPGLSFVTASERAWQRVESASLPRFYWDWRRYRAEAGEGHHAVHPRRLDRRRPRRRARPAARRGARDRFRPSHRARPRVPRRRQGDGPRALFARRRPLGNPDRRADARRAWMPSRCVSRSATGTA